MKSIYYLIIALLLGVPVLTHAQFEMEDVAWKSLPSPGLNQENISGNLSSLEITDNGNIYFVFFDTDLQALHINKFDVTSNTWTSITQETVLNITAHQVKT